MSINLRLSVEQLADAVIQLSPMEVEELERLIDQKTSNEILTRSKEVHKGKYIPLKEAKAFKDID